MSHSLFIAYLEMHGVSLEPHYLQVFDAMFMWVRKDLSCYDFGYFYNQSKK